MTEAEWLARTDPEAMLYAQPDQTSDRRHRLVACACCRSVPQVLAEPRCLRAVEVAERHADGLASSEELAAARQASARAHYRAASCACDATAWWAALRAARWAARGAAYPAAKRFLRSQRAAGANPSGEDFLAVRDEVLAASRAVQTDLLREILGNPFHPVAFDPSWRTPQTLALAQGAYAERQLPSGELDGARLGVLADALEEGGCTAAALLAHLRSPGPHVRGCFALDAVLNRE